MKKNIIIKELVQILLSDTTIEKIATKYGHSKKTRKLTLKDLVIFLIVTALEQSKSYREAVTLAKKYGLPEIHYSELSKRTSELSYEIMKEIFEYTLSECNRKFRRSVRKIQGIKQKILAIDSTTITTSKTQLKWAGFHGQRSGVKLHVKFDTTAYTLEGVVESVAKSHDSKFADQLKDEESILVEDRAYGKIDRFDQYSSDEEKQLFVIRIKENLTLVQARKLKRLEIEDSNVLDDITCQLGSKKKRSKNRFRVVTFQDDNGKKIIVCTNIMNTTAEIIAEIYKQRWAIETFFRFVKQNLNLSRIFGTTKNAVFNQLYASLLAFVIIRFTYSQTSPKWKFTRLTMIEFIRCLRTNYFADEVFISIADLLRSC